MASTTAVNQNDNQLEEVVVTGRRAATTSTASEAAHKAIYLEKSQQNLELKGQLAGYVSVGGSWRFTGNASTLYIGNGLQFPFKFFEVEIQKTPTASEYSYAHLAYADSEGYNADQQKNNYHNDAYLTGFNCGGFTYQPCTAGASLSAGVVLKNDNVGSGEAAATVTAVGSGDQVTAGIMVCNEKGGNSASSSGKLYALTAGVYLSSSITAATGSDVNYTTSGALTDAAGQGFAVGRVFQAKGSNNYAVLSLDFKKGFRTGI